MSIIRQGTLPVGSLDHAITLNVQSGESHFETVTDTTPYLYRTSPQDVANMMKLKKVVGGTVAWNQQIYNGNFADATGWERITGATVSISNNECVATITGNFGGLRIATSLSADYKPLIISGHKYLISAQIKASAQRTNCVGLGLSDDNSHYPIRKVFSVGTSYSDYAFIGTQTDGNPNRSKSNFMVYDTKGSDGVTLYVKNIIAIDLTQMFGSTIADYIYSLEQAHAGDGVAWFRKLFPKSYYAYNSGELMSVKTSAHKTVGFNQWDEEWEVGSIKDSTGQNTISTGIIRSTNYIPVIPNASYYAYVGNGAAMRVFFYDASKNFISYINTGSTLFTIPSDVAYIRFRMYGAYGTTYNNDICINISSLRNGEYEPYVEHNYPLDSDLELRGIPKLDSNNKLYYDGDEYEPSGTVTRKYGVRAYQGGDSTDGSTMVTDGTNTVYKLITPTTESADAYTQAQRVGASEEFVDARTVAMPVGNESEYKRLIQGDTP